MLDKSIIILFVKAPVRGRVKTRLAAAIGDDAALGLYQNFVLDVLETVKKTGHLFALYVHPPDTGEATATWPGGPHRVMPQQGADLGERMENAFLQCFAEGIERVVLIGSDLPDLTPALLREAVSALAKHDVVIGPASDGGYYLIGFNRHTFLPKMFHGMTWGADTVFQETMTVLNASALAIYRTPEWHDVDTVEDLKALCLRSKKTWFDKSRTMDYLRKIGFMAEKGLDG
jgi:rSAM/selenodomain-associated transferase 1